MTVLVVPAYPLTWTFDFDPDAGPGVPAPQYAFGVNTVAHSFWFHFGVDPLQWFKIGSGGGGVVLGVDLENQGVPVVGNPHSTLNFTGAGVTTTDVGGVGTILIPGGGSGPQVFEYLVLGTEPDLSALVIPIPVATADVSYGVVATCQGCAGIVPFDIPNASKTTTQFVAIATGDLTAGDVITFFLSPLT